jgi:fused signal recognition particle receptor
MFGLLKNKLTSFVKGLVGREEKKEPEKNPPTAQQPIPPVGKGPTDKLEAQMQPGSGLSVANLPEQRQLQPMAVQPSKKKAETPKAAEKPEAAKMAASAGAAARLPGMDAKKEEIPKNAEQPFIRAPESARKSLIESVAGSFPGGKKPEPSQKEEDLSRLGKKAIAESRSMAPKIGIGTVIKSFFSGEITIGEAEVGDLLSELELSLLEADVAYEVSLEVTSQLRRQLIGMKVPKGEIEKRTRETIAQALESVMESGRKFDFVEKVKSCEKPAKVLFVGPNGAGKTTTMAKVARMLLDSGLSVVFSASDTFRAAAIEQTEVHAGRLGVKAIKSRYGADPASVAFDAINYARSHSVDVVIIDSAGRQETNANLLAELKKIVRVAKPDIKLYVGESIGGNSVIEQIRTFDSTIGIDGAILTKIDCDAKGGTAISIAKAAGIPVLYLGVGQGYSDLVPFDAHRIALEIMT